MLLVTFDLWFLVEVAEVGTTVCLSKQDNKIKFRMGRSGESKYFWWEEEESLLT